MLKAQPDRLDAVFAALAHPIRRAIVERLAKGECTVSELAEPHDVSLPAISQHLRVLEEAGLLEQTPDGRVRRCALKPAPFRELGAWIQEYGHMLDGRLDRFADLVEREGAAKKRRRKGP